MLRDAILTLSLDLARRVIYVFDGISLAWAGLRGRRKQVPAIGEGVSFLSGARRLYGWLVTAAPAAATQRPVAVLILHGIGDKLPYWRLVQDMLARETVSSLIFDYSGYGRSQGPPSQANLEQDALTAYAWLRRQVTPSTAIHLLGYSLGTGLAAEIAPRLEPPPASVILCESYTSFRDAADRVVGPLRLLRYLVRNLWRTRVTVCRCPAPLLLIHGEADALFPVSMSRTIRDAAVEAGVKAELVVVAGCVHNGGYLYVPADYWKPALRMMKGDAMRANDT